VLRFRFRAPIALALSAGLCSVRLAGAEAAVRPPEKVRVTYDATPGCPTSNAFFAQVRERVGTDWEAPPNELARTIEVRVTGGADKSVARIDFVDENREPIARVVTAKTCDEVVAGIALVTALAIESRIAEVVGKSEPPAAAPPPTNEAPTEERKATPAPVAAPPGPAAPTRSEPSGPPPHVDIGAGALASVGALPHATVGFRGFAGIGFPHGLDFRLGVDYSSAGSVETTSKAVGSSGSAGRYLSSFSLLSGRASVCPFAFGTALRLLPCGGVEVGVLHAEGLGSSGSAIRTDATSESNPVWFAPFLGARADATWDVFFVEFEASAGFPISPKKRDFVFETASAGRTVTDTVYAIWPVVPAASLAVGVRL
jgi:hypothetical protein